jgi:hypothetical protein
VQATAKDRRIRQSPQGFSALPPLRPVQQAVLQRWLQSAAQERAWQSLLQATGKTHLHEAEGLLQALLWAGALAVKEKRTSGQWRVERVVWRDLPAVQQAAGITTAAQHAALRDANTAQLQALAQIQPQLAAAAQSALQSPAALQRQRLALLEALLQWQQAQRSGMRQDFALAARGHTKGITNTEWDWLQTHLSLEDWGVGRFEPLFWLAGTLALQGPAPSAQLALQGLHFLGLPCRQLRAPWRVALAPQRYWLIENRASFERQAAQREQSEQHEQREKHEKHEKHEDRVCIIWLPGRPSGAWLDAMAWLLAQAPAPAAISCDPDPAGIQIALSAGQLWDDAQLPWRAQHMSAATWQNGTTRALNDYDLRVLNDLHQHPALPPELADLRDYMLSSGHKAEQEGWL